MADKIGLIDRIRYDFQTGCWNWVGSTNGHRGYGYTSYLNKNRLAHRLAAHLWLGMSLSNSLQVCHRCDNPACFNPKHLFIGTQSDNLQDQVAKGRHPFANRTHCKHGHPFNKENTGMKNLKAIPASFHWRYCRACRRKKKENRQ